MHKTGLLVLIALLITGCGTVQFGQGPLSGSGNVTTEPRTVAAFNAIDMSGVGEVIITQGEAVGLNIEADDNFQPLILSEVRNDTLFLSMKPKVNLRHFTRMIFHVTIKEFTRLTLSGAALVKVHNLSGDKLTVDHSGAGSVTIAGTVNEQRVTLSGAGTYDGAALVSKQATVDLRGLGSMVVQVRERLDATISGAGSIEYIGSPELHKTISGLGSIRQRGP